MYIQEIEIKNMRSIERFRLELDRSELAGWHVLIGDNGSGKSTVVRAIALAIIGPNEAPALRQNWSDWLGWMDAEGWIALEIEHDEKYDKRTGGGRPVERWFIPAKLILERYDLESGPAVTLRTTKSKPDPHNYLWGTGSGWFAASFGPFRRFGGGDKDYEKLYYSNPRLGSHLTAFGEDIALTEIIPWLQFLRFKSLEGKGGEEKQQLDALKRFINKGGLLPHGAVLEEISSDGVLFVDGNGCRLPIEQLSDGYRSILSLTFELIRQMIRVYGPDKVFADIHKGDMKIDLPGVVVIDEVDAHLHPTWQRRVGQWFCRYFPKIQFIVTTHSPLICQGAERGSVWRLPTPGDQSAFSGRVTGTDLDRLVYGSVEDAYDTDLFGQNVSRSASSQEKLQRLAVLNRKSLRDKLTSAEKKELQRLRTILPSSANTVAEENGESS
jgi:energy-coupling factor transporter ATP-binding protein EcfA2